MRNQLRTATDDGQGAHRRRVSGAHGWRFFTAIAMAAVVTACADEPTSTRSTEPAASEARSPHSPAQPTRYEITDLGGDLAAAGFDGAFAIAYDIDQRGRVAGAATVPGGYQRGFLWSDGRVANTGTFGGDELNSSAGGRAGRRALAMMGEVPSVDPLAENFCGFGTSLICRAGVWHNGEMTVLPTLGGNNAAATETNSWGQIVGVAEDGVLDNSCMPPQKSHFQAVYWSGGRIHKLSPLPGDEVAMAGRNNDRGQIVGTSGLCSNTFYGGLGIGPHAVLWDHGTPIDLGNLGDDRIGFAAAVNNRGEVFGSASVSDGTSHAFRWTRRTGIRDLGLMSSDPTDAQSTPFQANDRGQMVGASCDVPFGTCRGYIWQNGEYTDLNTLIPPDSKLYIVLPFGINESGEITGMAVDIETGAPHAFLATPARGAAGAHAMVAARSARSRPRLPESLRALVRRPRMER